MPTSSSRSRGSGKPRPARRSPGKASPGKDVESPGDPPESPSSESPSESAPAVSSGRSSPAATSSLLGNPGPAFEGRQLAGDESPDAAAPAAAELQPAPLEWWTPERAETIAKAQGVLTHNLIGVGETDWIWQPGELQAVSGPLASGLNSVDLLRRLAPYADAIGGLMAVGAYVGRSRRERADALMARAALVQPVPVSGVDAEGQPSEHEAARRHDLLQRILGRDRAATQTEPEPPAAAAGDGSGIQWRLGE